MHLLDQTGGMERIGLACAGRSAANLAARHRARLAEHDGAAGQADGIGGVTDADAGDVSE